MKNPAASQTKAELIRLECAIKRASRHKLFGSTGWVKIAPDEPGVYVIWNKRTKKPEYVGESSSLRQRLRDLGRWENHTFRSKVAEKLGEKKNNNNALSQKISALYEFSFIHVTFGRAELEEYLILRWRAFLINKPAVRLLNGNQYSWVRPHKFTKKLS